MCFSRTCLYIQPFPRSSLDMFLSILAALVKGEGQQARVALVKLQKDFERVRNDIQGVMRDAQAVEISE